MKELAQKKLEAYEQFIRDNYGQGKLDELELKVMIEETNKRLESGEFVKIL